MSDPKNILLRIRTVPEAEQAAAKAVELRRLPYTEYLTTGHWRAKREDALWRAGFRCQVCSSQDLLEVHHNTYKNLGDELDEDLMVLCRGCHAIVSEHVVLTK